MDNSDLLPNDGEYFLIPDEPEEQVKERTAERAKTTAALPLLNDLISRWKQMSAFYDSIDSIQVDIDEDPATFQKVHAANKVIKQGFEQEIAYLEELRDTHKR